MYSCRFSPDGTMLALGSRDNAIYIYQVSYDKTVTIVYTPNDIPQVKDSYRKFVRQGRCLGHSSPVVQLDWSRDCSFLQSNSQDNEVSVILISDII